MSGWRWNNPEVFPWLLLIPFFWAIGRALVVRQRRRMQAIFSANILPFLSRSVAAGRRQWKSRLLLLGIALSLLALARPQSGQRRQKMTSAGIEVIWLVDVSLSMLAEDVAPNRLELVKKEMLKFLEAGGSDRMGLIAFAGSTVLLSPITSDQSALRMFIETLSPEMVMSQGTEIKQALEEAELAFRRGGVTADDEVAVARAVILVSDGEDHEPGAVEVAQTLRKDGIRVFGLSVGSDAGGPIPLNLGGGGGYKRDKSGAMIITRTNEAAIEELAKAGGGAFYRLSFGGQAMGRLRADLDRLEKAQFASQEFSQYDEKYQWFLFFSILFFLLELTLSERRSSYGSWRGRFEVES